MFLDYWSNLYHLYNLKKQKKTKNKSHQHEKVNSLEIPNSFYT